MSEADETPERAAATAEPQPGPGARLLAAREQAGLSVHDVAHELYLDVAIVKAVEADQLDTLGAPVFVKGYLRGYARLVDLPEQELVDSWQPAEADAEAFRAQSVQTEMRTGASLSNFVLWVLLGLLVLGSLIYLLAGDNNEPAVQAVPAASAEPAELPLPERDSEFVVEEAAAAEFSLSEPEPATKAESQPTAAVSPVAEPAQPDVAPLPEPETQAPLETVSVTLTFSDECWVELSDSRRRLLYGLEKAGSVRNFSARLPLRFFVGNAEAVQISIGEQPYVIPARVRTGRNTARFVLNADELQGLQ